MGVFSMRGYPWLPILYIVCLLGVAARVFTLEPQLATPASSSCSPAGRCFGSDVSYSAAAHAKADARYGGRTSRPAPIGVCPQGVGEVVHDIRVGILLPASGRGVREKIPRPPLLVDGIQRKIEHPPCFAGERRGA